MFKEEMAYLESKRPEGYASYMKAAYEVSWNKILKPVWIVKDNFSLFARVFVATLMFMILMVYIGDVYAEWEMQTQAGIAAFLIVKIWFSYKLFQWVYPSGIVERAKETADRLEEVWQTKKLLKEPSTSVSE